ncbi:hypothetical protein [Acidovorax carolinensis]|nr:hypothetical protein [Acidovorax carolinensis]
MNFMAWAYWTDGWYDDSLMPNDEGLRRCTCGQFFLLQDMKAVEEGDDAEGDDLPSTMAVPDEQLPECFAQPVSAEVEVAARLGYWRYLNHDFRSAYVEHRDAEAAPTRTTWLTNNPDRRTWWDSLLRRPAPRYSRPEGGPFTHPPYEPTPEQLADMELLCELLQQSGPAQHRHALELAELYREQGRFGAGSAVLQAMVPKDLGTTGRLIARLIEGKERAPMRYGMCAGNNAARANRAF